MQLYMTFESKTEHTKPHTGYIYQSHKAAEQCHLLFEDRYIDK